MGRKTVKELSERELVLRSLVNLHYAISKDTNENRSDKVFELSFELMTIYTIEETEVTKLIDLNEKKQAERKDKFDHRTLKIK